MQALKMTDKDVKKRIDTDAPDVDLLQIGAKSANGYSKNELLIQKSIEEREARRLKHEEREREKERQEAERREKEMKAKAEREKKEA